MEAYCMKCRTKREIKGAQKVTLKNGRPATGDVSRVRDEAYAHRQGIGAAQHQRRPAINRAPLSFLSCSSGSTGCSSRSGTAARLLLRSSDVLGAETVQEDDLRLFGATRTVVQAGESEFELLEPAGEGAVADHLERWGEGIFAAGFSTDDPSGLARRMVDRGLHYGRRRADVHRAGANARHEDGRHALGRA